ncbi:MAG: hypothetical protein QOF88_761, partial [Mycobacterium sp.]|nr:hypothetical protein [Mycobacterium sp.]
SSQDALGGRLALHLHPGFKLMYELLGLSAKHFEDSYAKAITKTVSAADREVLADEEVMQSFLDASRECFRHGADDATMLYEAWPFDMTSVTRLVHFGRDDDTLVPEAINKTVADQTPGAIWHPISGGGHFIAVSHANDILALAANDLASAPR